MYNITIYNYKKKYSLRLGQTSYKVIIQVILTWLLLLCLAFAKHTEYFILYINNIILYYINTEYGYFEKTLPISALPLFILTKSNKSNLLKKKSE